MGVQRDDVAVADQAQRTARSRLGADVQNTRAVGGSAHPGIGNPHHVGDALAQQLAGDGQLAPFGHAGGTARAGIAQHQHGSGPVDGGTTAGLEQACRAPAEPSAARTAPVGPTAPEPVQTAAGRAYARRLFAEQRQHRTTGANRPQLIAVRVRQTAPHRSHGVPETAACARCGCVDAPRRRFLPTRRSHVCDECWTGAPDQAGSGRP